MWGNTSMQAGVGGDGAWNSREGAQTLHVGRGCRHCMRGWVQVQRAGGALKQAWGTAGFGPSNA